MNQANDQQIIQQVIDQAVKAGIFQNIDSAAVVWRAWGTIKYKLEQLENEQRNNSTNS
jgi:hypothetical protein